MISRQKAVWLLSKYEAVLNQFQDKINSSSKALLRCDSQIIPNVIAALRTIAAGQTTLIPSVASSGMSSIKELDNDPQAVLNELLVDDHLNKHFKAMCAHYGNGDDKFRAEIDNFHSCIAYEKLVVYKAKNGQLAVKFPSIECRDTFINELGGQKQFASGHAYFASQSCPEIFSDHPNTIYIPAYTAKNGELAAVFPDVAMRDVFRKLLRHAPENCMSVYHGRDALYFNDRKLHNSEYNIAITVPMEIAYDRYRAEVEVRYAARMVGQGIRDVTSLFAQLPSELNVRIAALATNNKYLPEEEGVEIAKQHLNQPSK